MFCTNCGNKLPDDAVFCPFCGEKVQFEAAPAVQETAAEEPPVAAAVQTKKKKTGFIAAIIAVVIIAVGVGGYFIYQNQPSTKLAKIRTTDPNGKEANVVLISEDGKSWYSMPDVNSPQGIYGCY